LLNKIFLYIVESQNFQRVSPELKNKSVNLTIEIFLFRWLNNIVYFRIIVIFVFISNSLNLIDMKQNIVTKFKELNLD